MGVNNAPLIRMLSAEDATTVYRDLRAQVLAAGLLEPALGYYVRTCALSYCLLAIGVSLALASPGGFPWVLANGLVLGIALVQIALVGHDAGHLAVFRSTTRNHVLGLICWSLTTGVGFRYWCDRHNRHHAHTNDVEDDPDLGWTALIAYDEAHATARQGWLRALTPYQAFIAALFIPLVALAFRVESWVFAIGQLRGSRRRVEMALLATNLLIWISAALVLGSRGISLFLITQVVAGGYLSFIIAPNHKGMPIWSADTHLSFVERQVLSSRNLTAHPVWDVVFGGLNYQIEHHLFPRMPRANLSRATDIVAPFCRAHDLPYEVASPVRAFADIFIGAHRIGQAARKRPGIVAVRG